jgi:phosphatidylserine/phosphatidylglycerophosphate/cardiolipin synthase-like enzyme
LIGSTNLSTNALDHNREISIITTDTWVINSQLSLFD